MGCFRNALATVGCMTLLVVGAVAGWQYRAQLRGIYHSVVGGEAAVVPATSGEATEDALRSARGKEAAMARRDGPAYVVLTAGEMAALVLDGMDPIARPFFSDVAVTLEPDRFTLSAVLNTRALTPELLGPFAGVLEGDEPVRIQGPARVGGAGTLLWEPDGFTLRAFPFPALAVPRLMNRLTGRSDGAVAIEVPPTVGDLRIRTDGVTFYRRVD